MKDDQETEADSESAETPEDEAEKGSQKATSASRATRPSSRLEKILAITDLCLAVLLLGGLALLPTRYLPVDLPAVVFAIALGVTGVGLWVGAPWALRAARVVAVSTLAGGALLSTALAFTAAHISGLYGPVGAGGAALLGVVALLLLPYLVLIPAAQLWLLLGKDGPAR